MRGRSAEPIWHIMTSIDLKSAGCSHSGRPPWRMWKITGFDTTPWRRFVYPSIVSCFAIQTWPPGRATAALQTYGRSDVTDAALQRAFFE
jgi:hypothetical protein